MQHASDPPKRLRFGVFEADLHLGELRKLGKRLPLQEQPFRLLAMLLARPGELVSRDELRAKIWPQTIVDFDHGLNKAISKIRDALGDSAESPRFIETVARRGYRFLADVTPLQDGQQHIPAAAPTVGAARAEARISLMPPRARNWRLVGFGLALVLAGVLPWILYTSRDSAPAVRSLAVLPLKNLSGDLSQDYFTDGMTEGLIMRLGQISALRVISSRSVMHYKGVEKPLAEIARELDVQAVVEGSVLRSGDQVRISTQLIRVPADEQVWSRSYEGDLRDALALQSKVAQAIAEQIRATLSSRQREALRQVRPVNPSAYEAYLKGRYFWNKRTADSLLKAIDYFSRAIQTDPTYAEAYSGLADSYALAGDWLYGVLSPNDAFRQARAAATRALALDDTLGEAHTSLAFSLDLYAWDWAAADKEYQRAIELNPGYATAHHWYGWHLLVMGRTSEGIFEMRRAESLDPLSLIISADLAEALCIAHLYDESVQQSKRTLDMDPDFAVAHYQLGQALAQKHLYDEAIAEFQRAIELSGHSGTFESNLAYVYALSGRKVEAENIMKDLKARLDKNPSTDANIALVYVGLGDHDQAMIWLDKAYEGRFNPSILLRPGFDPLRSDARFEDLRHRLGLE
jgi:TolB-like protein/DNA-binding winged helix-turn-helix (wHTH) protein/Flp pilus assembly protein TadD